MTRFRVLVVGPGDRLDDSMAPYDEKLEVDPYFVALSDEYRAEITDGENLPEGASDETLVPFIEIWMAVPGAIHNGVLGYFWTKNPRSKWDYWVPLAMPLLNGATATTARKGDIDQDAQPVAAFAVLAEGVWRAPGDIFWLGQTSASDDDMAAHYRWFEQFWAAMPDDTEITLVECHI